MAKVIDEDDDIIDIFNNIHTLFRRRQKKEKFSIAPNLLGGGGVVVFEAGYTSIITAGETPPSAAQQIKQNQLYKRFSNSGILTLTDAWYVLRNDVAGGFWKLNWKAPASFKCTEPAGAVTKTSNAGINGNGSSTYADCNFTPSTQAAQLSATTGGAQALYLHTVPTTGSRLNGARNVGGTSPYLYMSYNSAIAMEYRTLDDGQGNTYTGGTPNGSFLYAEGTTSEHKLWKNGVSVQSALVSVTLGLPANSLRIGSAAGNAGGFSDALIGMQWWGAPLSDVQKLEMYNAWVEYIS